MRLFVAADLPDSVMGALRDNLDALGEAGVAGKLVPRGNLHATLAFLGEVDKGFLPGIEAALMYAVEDVAAFEVALGDYGAFSPAGSGEAASPKVLWQGFEDDAALERLAAAVRRELDGLGVPYDDQFKPHVTLARKVTADVGDLPEPWVDGGLVESVTLYRSRLSSDGAVYEPLHTAKLREPYRHPEGPLVIVDADACPVVRETLYVARKAKVPALLVANGTQNLDRHIRRNDPRRPRRGYWVATMNVAGGADSADFQIATLVREGDVVVTQDTGVAAMAIGAGARAVGVRGREYTREAIDAMLLVRHEEKKIRRQGGRTQGPAAFSDGDRERFTATLASVLGWDPEPSGRGA